MKRLLSFSILAIFLMSTACHVGRKDPVKNHAGPPPVVLDAKTQSEVSLWNGLDLKKLYTSSEEKGADLVSSALIPLSERLMDPKFLENRQGLYTEQARWALQFYNTKLLEAVAKNPQDSRLQKLLKDYRQALLDGCTPGTNRDCRNFHFFRRDGAVVNVLKVLARGEQNVTEYFRLIFLAYELSPDRRDDELTEMVARKTLPLLKTFVNVRTHQGETLLSLREMTLAEQRTYRQTLTFLATVFQSGSTEAKVRGLKDSSNELLSWFASPNFTTVVSEALAREFNVLIAEWIKSPDVWAKILGNMSLSEANDSSYSSYLKKLPADLMKRMGLSPFDLAQVTKGDPRQAVGTYFLTRIFNLQPLNQERYLWNMSNKDPKQAMDQIQTIVRVAFLSEVLESHKKVAKIFNDFRREGRLKTEFLRLTVERAQQQLAPPWKTFFSQAQRLESFFSAEFESIYGNSSDPEIAKKVKETRALFEQINPSLKAMVSYPVMIMFSYFAAVLEYSEDIRVPGRVITIDKSLFILELMKGNSVPPLFVLTNYTGNDRSLNDKPLSQSEMMMAFHYLLELRAYDLYGVKLSDFMREILSAYVSPYDEKMRAWIVRLDQMNVPSADFPQLLRICETFQKPNGRWDFDVRATDLWQNVFLGDPGTAYMRPPLKGVADQIQLGPKSALGAFDEAIETLRIDVDPKWRWLSLVRKTIEGTANSSDKALALRTMDERMKESFNLKSNILKSIEKLTGQIAACTLQVSHIEIDRSRQLTLLELQYVDDVYTALEILNELKDDGQVTLSQLRARQPTHRLFTEARFTGLDPSVDLRTAFNLWLADKTGLADAFKAMPNYRADYTMNGGIRRDFSGTYFYMDRSRDFIIRMAEFLKNGYNSTLISPKPDQTRILWPSDRRLTHLDTSTGPKEMAVFIGDSTNPEASRNAFKSQILQSLVERTNWFGGIASTTNFFRHLNKMTAASFKYKFHSEMDPQKIVTCADDCQRQILSTVKSDAGSLVELSNKFLDRVSLNPTHAEFLKLLNKDSFYLISGERSYYGPYGLFLTGFEEPTGTLDDIFTMIAAKRLGYNPIFWTLRGEVGYSPEDLFRVPPTSPFEDQFTKRESTTQAVSRPDIYWNAVYSFSVYNTDSIDSLFPVDSSIKASIRALHKYPFQIDMLIAAGVEQAATEWTQSGQPISPLFYSLRKAAVERPHLLSQGLFSTYLQVIRDFNNTTAGHYVPSILKGDTRWYSGTQ